MLVTFKSAASADVIMFGDAAKSKSNRSRTSADVPGSAITSRIAFNSRSGPQASSACPAAMRSSVVTFPFAVITLTFFAFQPSDSSSIKT